MSNKWIICAIGLTTCFALVIFVKSSKQDSKQRLLKFNDVKQVYVPPYPVRQAAAYPTKSLDEIREVMFANGPRVKVDSDNAELPPAAFGDAVNNVVRGDKFNFESAALQDVQSDSTVDQNTTAFPKLPGENIVSMSLYGNEAKYMIGAIKNAELIKKNFPGWKLRIYLEANLDSPRYGLVSSSVIKNLRQLGVDLQYIDTKEDSIPPMMWRFLVADDEWVDRFIIRDSDSRLTMRDAFAVNAWVQSNATFGCVRDHPSHAAYAISGGMWGARARELRRLLRTTWREMLRGSRADYLEDMNFLNSVIWPKVMGDAYCADSVSCTLYNSSHPFTIRRHGFEHVGQVYEANDLGRSIDIQILAQAGENQECVPTPVKI